MYIKISWDEEFVKLMMDLWSVYGKDMFSTDGIGQQLDLNHFSKKFFTEATTTADVSVDANANVTGRTSIEYNFELAKPIKRYNSYFLLWKELRKLYGLNVANKIIEKQLTGEFYINDFTSVSEPYSYHPHTVIMTNEGDYTLEELFTKYNHLVNNLPDREVIDLRSLGCKVWDGEKYVDLYCILRHKSHCDLIRFETKNGKVSIVTEDHPVITNNNLDGISAEFVKIGDQLVDKTRCEFIQSDNYLMSVFIKSFNNTTDKVIIPGLDFKTAQQFAIFAESLNYKNIQMHATSDNTYELTFYPEENNSYEIDNSEVIKIDHIPFKNEYVYDIQTETGRFASNGLYCHNCFNYSTYDIALNGLNGISSRLNIVPPKSFETFIRQVEQFIVYAANSTLGATGLADILIVGAHFIDKIKETGFDGKIRVNPEDLETYIKEKLASFIYTVNWEFRGNQCVTEDTDVLTPNGFKTLDELKPGDDIYTWKDGKLNTNKVQRVNIYDYNGTMHSYEGTQEVVTPNHRVLYTLDGNNYILKQSSDVFELQDKVFIPVGLKNTNSDFNVSNDDLDIYANDIIEHKINVPEWINKLSAKQAKRIINIWAQKPVDFDIELENIKVNNKKDIDILQHLCVLAEYSSTVVDNIFVITAYKNSKVGKIDEIQYSGRVWCPTTEDGVVIFRKNGKVFISGNSPFTNLSVFDDHFLNALVPEYVFTDTGTSPNIETVKLLQRCYISTMNDEMARSAITFPVTTACFSVTTEDNLKEEQWKGYELREIKDKEFERYIAEENLKFGFINIYTGDTSQLSSCCFEGNEKVLIKTQDGVEYVALKDLFDSNKKVLEKYLHNMTVFHNGKWSECTPVIIPRKEHKLFKVTAKNKKSIIVTDNHIHPTLMGDKKTTELTKDDYLNFNCHELPEDPNNTIHLTYNQGYLVGVFASCNKFPNALRVNVKKISTEFIKHAIIELGAKLESIKIENSPLDKTYMDQITIDSNELIEFINKYVELSYPRQFKVENIIPESVEFRNGIIDGWKAVYNRPFDKLYAPADNLNQANGIPKLMETGDVILVSLGYLSSIDYEECDEEGASPLPTLFINKRGSDYCAVESVEEYDCNDEYVYCVEMKNQNNPYFTLPNGINTHNCRLRSSTKNEYFNSFGAGSTKIGSLGVVTINLPRLAMMAKDKDKFLEMVNDTFETTARINNAKRNIIKKRIKSGAAPLYTYGYMDINKQYSTAGVVGINEAVSILGMDILTEEGQEFVSKMLIQMNECADKCQKKYNTPHNIEQTPSESSAVKLAMKDKMLGYDCGVKLYSNQFIPLIVNADMLERIELQGKFDALLSGGAICHINCDEEIKDPQKLIDLIEYAAKCGVVYWAINYKLHQCAQHHTWVATEHCPICGEKYVNELTRVVGFITNTKNWNPVRREYDWPNRQFYSVGMMSVNKQ